jgi:hypothetical protein
MSKLENEICGKVQSGNYVVRPHAFREAFKDGITQQDILQVLLTGEVIEDYRPEREECLMLGYTIADNIPVHVAVNHEERVIIKTCYVPQTDQWIKNKIRKRR